MGCYGIGVSRLVAAIYEASVTKDAQGKVTGIALPKEIAPYTIQIVPKMENEEKVKDAMKLYDMAQGKAILDDRTTVTFGSKIKDCKILGTPYMAILGDKVENGKVELENLKTGEKEVVDIENVMEICNK